jgi:hypothetical protein
MRRALAIGVSLLCFAGSGLMTVHASASFYGYTVLSQASGLEVVEDRPTANSHPEGDGEVPLSRVSLLSGPVGYALGTVAWPSALAANAGDLLVFAGNGNVPSSLGPPLNEPVRAETRTGGPAEVRNDTYPGASMHALVKPAQVAADAVVDGAQAGSATGSGKSETHSTGAVGDGSVSATARASMRDVSLAAGVVKIGSVVSQASARSDGTTATASGTTTVSGLTVGGVPVTVDGTGVHVAGQGSPVDTATVNSTLASIGMQIVLSGPTQTRHGATISYDSGSLIVFWNPSPDESLTARIGGARVTAGAFLADPAVAVPGAPRPPVVVGGAPVPATGLPSIPVVTGGQPTSAPVPPVVAGPAPASTPVLLAGESVPDGAVALAGLGALVLLAGLLRFPSAVLASTADAPCPPRSS